MYAILFLKKLLVIRVKPRPDILMPSLGVCILFLDGEAKMHTRRLVPVRQCLAGVVRHHAGVEQLDHLWGSHAPGHLVMPYGRITGDGVVGKLLEGAQPDHSGLQTLNHLSKILCKYYLSSSISNAFDV